MNNTTIREEIAKTIAEAVQKGCPPWRCPWGNSPDKKEAKKLGIPMTLPRNFLTGHMYTGVNPLLIMIANDTHGFQSPYWGSMVQWSTLGGYVKPRPHHVPEGKWGTGIVFFTTVEKKKAAPVIPTEDGAKDTYMILRRHTIFNADQIVPPDVERLMAAKESVQIRIAKRTLGTNIKQMTRPIAKQIHYEVEAKLRAYQVIFRDTTDPFEGGEHAIAEALLKATGAKFRFGGNQALYRHQPDDYILLPHKKDFDSPAAYYETALHEVIHWAEDEERVGQSPKHKGFAKEPYAFSELVAEIGACFLAAETGLPIHEDMLPRSQSYVQYWLGQIGSDPKYIWEAATQSSKIVDFLLQIQHTNKKEVGHDYPQRHRQNISR